MNDSIFKGNYKSSDIMFVDDTERIFCYSDFIDLKIFLADIIEPRSLTLIICDSSIDAISIYLAHLENKVVPILVSSNLKWEYIVDICKSYRPQFIIGPKKILEKKFKEGKTIFSYYVVNINKEKVVLYDDLALLLLTSGSIGGAKSVRISYENLYVNTKQILAYLPITKSEKPLLSLPMEYTYGMSIINTHFMTGATMYISSYKFFNRNYWLFFNKNNCTSFAGVPYSYETLDTFHFFNDRKMPSLHYMTQAGGKLNGRIKRKVTQFCEKNNADFYVMYGQTEATSRISYLPPSLLSQKIESIGRPVANGKIDVINEEGKIIDECFKIGELIYSGRNVSLGYAKSYKDLKKERENNYQLRTGDLGYFDKEGCFYITGRKSRIVKISGYRYELDEIEYKIQKQVNIECKVMEKEEHIYVFFDKNEYRKIIKKVIENDLNIPEEIISFIYLKEIPRGENGKVLYSELKKLIY